MDRGGGIWESVLCGGIAFIWVGAGLCLPAAAARALETSPMMELHDTSIALDHRQDQFQATGHCDKKKAMLLWRILTFDTTPVPRRFLLIPRVGDVHREGFLAVVCHLTKF